jgi:hypothetical protein
MLEVPDTVVKGCALCGISEFEENEKKCLCLLYNCSQFLQLYSSKYATYKPSHDNHSIDIFLFCKKFIDKNTRLRFFSLVHAFSPTSVFRVGDVDKHTRLTRETSL